MCGIHEVSRVFVRIQCQLCIGMCALANHDHDMANVGSGGGGRGRPEARRGASECARRPMPGLCNLCGSLRQCSNMNVFCIEFEYGGAEAAMG
jgi:hypothetical protein